MEIDGEVLKTNDEKRALTCKVIHARVEKGLL